MEELAKDGLVRVLDHQNARSVAGVQFLGYSYTPPTPWFVKDFERLDVRGDEPPLIGGARWDHRFSRMVQHGSRYIFDGAPTMADELGAVHRPADPWVFVVHAPPHASKLDQAFGNNSWGSRAVRQALERLQPLLSLHGHIHESPMVSGSFRDTIGKTTAINPGQSSAELCYAAIELDVANQKLTKLEHGRQT
jgi:Icc-related predicted phosphoesterase